MPAQAPFSQHLGLNQQEKDGIAVSHTCVTSSLVAPQNNNLHDTVTPSKTSIPRVEKNNNCQILVLSDMQKRLCLHFATLFEVFLNMTYFPGFTEENNECHTVLSFCESLCFTSTFSQQKKRFQLHEGRIGRRQFDSAL